MMALAAAESSRARATNASDLPESRTIMPKRVGLLALQGDFHLHRLAVERLGHKAYEIRKSSDLRGVDCLIMPGGESTTVRKLMRLGGLEQEIETFAQSRPVMGTCAGLILLSCGIEGDDGETLGLLDCTVARNAYGRQVFSFRDTGEIRLHEHPEPFEMVFIRAPRIRKIGPKAEVVGHLDGEPTMVRQGHILGMTFHPELAEDGRIHNYFLSREFFPK